MSIFREEAMIQHPNWMGAIFIARPLSIWLCSVGSFLFMIALVVFIYFASYTQRTTVSGQLVPTSGIIKLYAPQGGIVSSKRVVEGQKVKKGEVLIELSSLRKTSALGDGDEFISRQIDLRKKSQISELEKPKTCRSRRKKRSAKK